MKYSLLILLLGAMSCQEQKTTPNTIQRPENAKITPTPSIEDEVFAVIDSVKNSNASNRKRYMAQLMAYANKVDGAVSEGYGNFAYEYAENKTADFYAVLSPADSVLVTNWANAASGEIQLVEENTAGHNSLLHQVEANHLAKRKELTPEQIKLDELYLTELRRAVAQ